MDKGCNNARCAALAARVTPERIERIVRALMGAQAPADWHVVSLHDVVVALQDELSDDAAGLAPDQVYGCLNAAAVAAVHHVRGMQFLPET